jgi:formamidopyrimidine-DNA glycosylase
VPELPEVEVVRRGLLPHVPGRVITRIEVREPRSLRRQRGGADAFIGLLRGRRVGRLERRGKFLWWRLTEADGTEAGDALMIHLGMSGQLRVRTPENDVSGPASALSEGPAPDPERHLRIRLEFDSGTRVDFVDQRIFGGMWLSELAPAPDGSEDLLPEDVLHVGRDLLDPALDLDTVITRLRSRSAPVKSLLLDQQLVSGIGNIYADEGLWEARTRFDTPGSALTARRARRVLEGTAQVMQRALEVGGTSFDALYVNVDGRSGTSRADLNVYGREGEPCKRCGAAIARVKFMNRSSHLCLVCQRKPSSKHR